MYLCNNKGYLSKFGNNTYTYDTYGNRKSKVSGGVTTSYSYTRGNFLASVGSSTYTYDMRGARVKKIANGVTTTYYLDGDKILGEDRSDGKKLRYFYDIDGLCGVRYNKTNYIYVRNAFGDVVMIVKDKKPVAKYFYDAHGNCQMETYNDTDGIGDLNPFRWRSHYYDAESGLYYANGSYYDPETGTHIDASEVSEIVDNAFVCFGLDRNGIMCNNVVVYMPNPYTIATILQMSADPTYDPDANKPWYNGYND